MKIAFDIGGVLSKYPQMIKLFQTLQKSNIDVYICSDMHPLEKVKQILKKNHIEIDDNHILIGDYSTYGEMCKAILIDKHRIDIFIDDHPGYLTNSKAVNLFVWPKPEEPYFHDDWRQDDSDFGRRVNYQHKAESIVTRVLNQEYVNNSTTLSSLNLDSIDMMEISLEIEKQCGVYVGLENTVTVGQLINQVRHAMENKNEKSN